MSKDYIERDVLLTDINESVVFSGRADYTSTEMRGANKVISRIKEAPAADVVDVVHGSWKKTHNRRLCSICNFTYYSNGDYFNYCPECGAKMDGKDGV